MGKRFARFKSRAPSRLLGHTRDTTTLVRDYLLQETLDPLKALARYVVAGTLGSFFVGMGALMLLIALLRLLQEETGAFHGNLSWIPYLIVSVVAAVVVGLTVLRIVSGPARRRRPRAAKGAS